MKIVNVSGKLDSSWSAEIISNDFFVGTVTVFKTPDEEEYWIRTKIQGTVTNYRLETQPSYDLVHSLLTQVEQEEKWYGLREASKSA